MENSNIIEAEKEAIRFLKRVDEYRNSEAFDKKDSYCFYSSPERAALRRSSMDLTKSLSKMRNK